MSLKIRKQQIRNEMLEKIDEISFPDLIFKSEALSRGFHDLLISTAAFHTFASKGVVSFHPIGSEPQINIESEARDEPYRVFYVRVENWNERRMVARECRRDQPGDWEEFELPGGKKLFQPSIHSREVVSDEISLVLVPGLAFSPRGGRLGRGAGFYDRFLRSHPEALRVGVAFQGQIQDELPCETWDEPIDVILTDQGLISVISTKLFGDWKTQGRLSSRS